MLQFRVLKSGNRIEADPRQIHAKCIATRSEVVQLAMPLPPVMRNNASEHFNWLDLEG